MTCVIFVDDSSLERSRLGTEALLHVEDASANAWNGFYLISLVE